MRITIFGTVGAGKSTLTKVLEKKLKWKIFYEPVENNPYLDDYYKDTKQYIFKMQVWILTARCRQLNEAINLKDVIFDRSILEDPIFVKTSKKLGLINDLDYQTYLSFYNEVIIPCLISIANFDLIVYLKTSTTKAIERIEDRGRKEEAKANLEYWQNLNQSYEEFYQENKNRYNFLVLDAENDNIEFKANQILEYIKKHNNNN